MGRSTLTEDLNIERKARPIAPGTSITVDADTGSDLNDGFSAPVATIPKLHDVLGRYNFNDTSIDIVITGTTLQNSDVTLNLSGLQNVASIEVFSGLRTEELKLENCYVPLEVALTTFEGDNARLTLLGCNNVEVKNSCTFKDAVAIFASIIAFDCNKVRVGTVGFTNYNGTVNFVYIDGVNNFSYDPLASPTTVGTLIRTTGYVGYIGLENGTASITGQILDIGSEGTVITYDGWNWTGTVPDTFPDYCVLNGVPIYNNLGIHADDTAAGVAGLVAGDVYRTVTGELRIKL